MGAVLAAVIQAPLMSILLLFELTRNYDVMLPIMLTAVTATVIYQLVFAESVYTQPLQALGIRVGSAAAISMLRRVMIDQLKLEPPRTIQAGQLVGDLLKAQQTVPAADYVVVDNKDNYLGILSMTELHTVVLLPEATPQLLVGEVCRSDVPPVLATDTLETAIDLFSRHEVNSLAVMKKQPREMLMGMLTRSDAMRVYQAALG
jgi:CIC family chloride channel protein